MVFNAFKTLSIRGALQRCQHGTHRRRGRAMRSITIRVCAVDFAERMSAMRLWLDDHRFEPSRFTYSEDGNDVLIDVDFKIATEAAAFSAQFA
jgi:hypothetical protein